MKCSSVCINIGQGMVITVKAMNTVNKIGRYFTVMVLTSVVTWIFGVIFLTPLIDIMQEKHSDCNLRININGTLKIPKILHQTWKTKDIPRRWMSAQHECKKLNPEYEYHLWDDSALESFIRREYSWFMPIYISYPYHIQRIDAARYFLLYHYGGIYLDLDIACLESFNNIIQNQTLSGHVLVPQTEPFGISNDVMFSSYNHPFMYYTIKHLEGHNHWYGLPYVTVLMSTGPLFLWKMYITYTCKNQIKIMAANLYTNVHLRHLPGSTWHRWDGKYILYIYTNYDKILQQLITLAIVLSIIMVCKVKLSQRPFAYINLFILGLLIWLLYAIICIGFQLV